MSELLERKKAIISDEPHLESASGSYASFETDMAAPLKECKIGFEPVQDLHGYDYPWPAGGGKNLLPDLEQNASNNGVTSSFDKETGIFTVNGTSTTADLLLTLLSIPPEMLVLDTTEYYTLSCTVVSGSMTVPEGTGITCALALFDSSNSSYIQGGTSVTTFENYSWYGRGITSSGNFRLYIQGWRKGIVFNNYKIKVQIEKGKVATAWAPYENVCPINGYDKLIIRDDSKYPGLIRWNQLVYDGCFSDSNNWAIQNGGSLTIENNTATASLTPNLTPSVYTPAIRPVPHAFSFIQGNKYYWRLDFNPTTEGRPYFRADAFNGAIYFTNETQSPNTWKTYSIIATATQTTESWRGYFGQANAGIMSEGDSFSYRNIMCMNLTEMFGKGNEPATVNDFENLFPYDYYNYEPGIVTTVDVVNGDIAYTVSIDSHEISKNLINLTNNPTTKTITNGWYEAFEVGKNDISKVSLQSDVTYTLSYNVESEIEPFAASVGAGYLYFQRDVQAKGNQTNGRISITFTPNDTKLELGSTLAIRPVRFNSMISQNCTFTISDMMLEIGNTASPYEPYSPILYGGYLDLINGRLILTSKYEDMKHTNHRYYMTSGTEGKYVYTNTGDSDRCALSAGRIGEAVQIELFTHGKIGNPYHNTQNPGHQVAWAFDGTIRFTAFGCETIEEFMEYVNSQEEFGLYYPLLTPIIYDLAPQQLKSLSGRNNIWSDANGDVEVKYWTH